MSARILLIEDNPTNRDLISYLLRSSGYEVDCEDDGSSGLAAALGGAYALVLTDILMPNMDGFEFVRRFRGDARFAHTPVIAMTALAMRGDHEKILAAGFDGYISKPIDPKAFISQVERFLGGASHG